MVASIITMLPSGASHLPHPLLHKDPINSQWEVTIYLYYQWNCQEEEVSMGRTHVCVCVRAHVIYLLSFYNILTRSKKNLEWDMPSSLWLPP